MKNIRKGSNANNKGADFHVNGLKKVVMILAVILIVPSMLSGCFFGLNGNYGQQESTKEDITEPESEENLNNNDVKWIKDYIDYIENGEDKAEYVLAYIDSDEIPELIVLGSSDRKVFVYYDGAMSNILTIDDRYLDVGYEENGNIMEIASPEYGDHYSIENGKAVISDTDWRYDHQLDHPFFDEEFDKEKVLKILNVMLEVKEKNLSFKFNNGDYSLLDLLAMWRTYDFDNENADWYDMIYYLYLNGADEHMKNTATYYDKEDLCFVVQYEDVEKFVKEIFGVDYPGFEPRQVDKGEPGIIVENGCYRITGHLPDYDTVLSYDDMYLDENNNLIVKYEIIGYDENDVIGYADFVLAQANNKNGYVIKSFSKEGSSTGNIEKNDINYNTNDGTGNNSNKSSEVNTNNGTANETSCNWIKNYIDYVQNSSYYRFQLVYPQGENIPYLVMGNVYSENTICYIDRIVTEADEINKVCTCAENLSLDYSYDMTLMLKILNTMQYIEDNNLSYKFSNGKYNMFQLANIVSYSAGVYSSKAEFSNSFWGKFVLCMCSSEEIKYFINCTKNEEPVEDYTVERIVFSADELRHFTGTVFGTEFPGYTVSENEQTLLDEVIERDDGNYHISCLDYVHLSQLKDIYMDGDNLVLVCNMWLAADYSPLNDSVLVLTQANNENGYIVSQHYEK